MSRDLTDDKSAQVQAMVWCRQATSHNWTNADQELWRHIASIGLNELRCISVRMLALEWYF